MFVLRYWAKGGADSYVRDADEGSAIFNGLERI